MDTFTTLTRAGSTTRAAARLTGISRATMDRVTARGTALASGAALTLHDGVARAAPRNKLTAAEEEQILTILHSEEFIDQAPAEVYATLLGRGEYICSIATMYRILRRHNEVRDRRRQARHPSRVRPELTATAPGQVYTWDITKLPGPGRGCWFDAYVMVDIYSRMIVGVRVHSHESAPLAAEMMREVFGVHGIPHVVHADRGTSMTSKTVAELLEDLGVTRSHSRPRVSNDNPFSESLFKTLKYAPTFPERFATLAEARAWISEFVDWYNHHHHHAGIGLHTPADVHHHRTATVQQTRRDALNRARQVHPERFATGTAEPKILHLPTSAWINRPEAPDQPEQNSAALHPLASTALTRSARAVNRCTHLGVPAACCSGWGESQCGG